MNKIKEITKILYLDTDEVSGNFNYTLNQK